MSTKYSNIPGTYGNGGRGGYAKADKMNGYNNGGTGVDGAVFITWVDSTATSTLSIDINEGSTGTYAYRFRNFNELTYGEFYQGEVVDLSEAANYLSRDGYVLLGFNTDPNVAYGGYQFVMRTEDVTLYAIWEKVKDN